MKDLGLKTYRFSVAWPRVFPKAPAPPTPRASTFTTACSTTLLAAGIQPYCTLFHWDLPQALEDKGGWQSRATSEAFANYAGYVAEHLSDRVKHFMTLNEMSSFSTSATATAATPWPEALTRLSSTRSATTLSSLTASPFRPSARTPSPEQKSASPKTLSHAPRHRNTGHIAAAAKAYREVNAPYLTPSWKENTPTSTFTHRSRRT